MIPNNGAIRSLVQAAVSAALAFGPAVAVIGWAGIDVTPAQVTMALMPVVMGLYWSIGNAIHKSGAVRPGMISAGATP